MARISFVSLPVYLMLAMASLARPASASGFEQMRISEAATRRVVRDGLDRSPTLRTLVQAIEAAGWIVFVQPDDARRSR